MSSTTQSRATHAAWKRKRYHECPTVRAKQLARVEVRNAILRGELTRGICEVCGSTRVQGHHDDYGQPLVVRWLCRKCHRQWHEANGPGRLPDVL